MGIYAYGITGTCRIEGDTALGTITASTIRYRFKRHLGSNADLLRSEERLDARYIQRWADRAFPRLVAHEGGLYVWLTSRPIADDTEHPFACAPLDGRSFDRLPEAEQLSLPMWVLDAIDAVDRRDIPHVPTTREAFYDLVREGVETREAARQAASLAGMVEAFDRQPNHVVERYLAQS